MDWIAWALGMAENQAQDLERDSAVAVMEPENQEEDGAEVQGVDGPVYPQPEGLGDGIARMGTGAEASDFIEGFRSETPLPVYGSQFWSQGEVGAHTESVDGVPGNQVALGETALAQLRRTTQGDYAQVTPTSQVVAGLERQGGHWGREGVSGGLSAIHRANVLATGASAYRVREVTATPLTMTSGRGSGVSAVELDRLVQRDARRYDSGFSLY